MAEKKRQSKSWKLEAKILEKKLEEKDNSIKELKEKIKILESKADTGKADEPVLTKPESVKVTNAETKTNDEAKPLTEPVPTETKKEAEESSTAVEPTTEALNINSEVKGEFEKKETPINIQTLKEETTKEAGENLIETPENSLELHKEEPAEEKTEEKANPDDYEYKCGGCNELFNLAGNEVEGNKVKCPDCGKVYNA